VLFRRTAARERRSDLHILPPGQASKSQPLVTVDALLAGGAEVVSAEEQARRERTRTPTSGIVDIDVSEDGQSVLIGLGERVFVFDRARARAHEVALGPGPAFDPHLAPNGKLISFVRDGDLWVGSALEAGQAPRRITQHPPGLEYGVAEFVAQEELDRRRGYFWSPDSRFIAFQRTDAQRVSTVYVSDPSHPERVPTEFKYPRAGADNAVVDLGIIAADGGTPRWVTWDLERFPYLAQVQWPKAGPLCLTVLNRAQTELALLAVTPETGTVRELLHVSDPAWVNLSPGSPTWLDDGSGFLWLREEEAGWELALHDKTGQQVRVVQPASFGSRSLAGVTPDGSAAIVIASQNPLEQHVFRVPLDGSAPLQLSAGAGVHEALAAYGSVVVRSALREGGSRATVIAPDGSQRELPQVAEQPTLVPETTIETVQADGRTYYAAITRPRNFDARRRYPVLVKVYGGPHMQTVLDYRDGYLLDQWYADAGFIVVRADGRGTPNRGRSWERAVLNDLASVPLADQVSVLEALTEKHPELDRSRVGIFGWSFGGYLSAIALLLRPDVFHAAVAGAPVTDWALYDTAYTERYMKRPVDNPEGYRRASALSHASALTRPMLLMHGLTDDNVHFAHSLALIDALYLAGKRVEVVTLSSTHMLTDPKLNLAREKLLVDFFREKLGH
jgi:dipeptidyl-peptidase-4